MKQSRHLYTAEFMDQFL